MNPNMHADIEVIRSWAPLVLAQGANADPTDLREVIRIRARLDATLSNDLENNGAPFFLLMGADRTCTALAWALLYLPQVEAEAAAAKVGGQLNSLSWYGIHNWTLTQEVLDHWTWMINDSVTNEMKSIHRAEVSRAFSRYEADKGRDYINEFFFGNDGKWRKWIDSEDSEALTCIVEEFRKETP